MGLGRIIAWRIALAVVLTTAIMAKADARNPSSASNSNFSYGKGSNPNSHYRSGYVRRDTGTYVAPHRATNPNRTRLDNYSTRPNYNPHTGRTGARRR
jgi:hypothetical protein